MGKSIRVTATGQVINYPAKLLRVIADPSANNGSFTLRDGDASGTIILGGTKTAKDSTPSSIECDIDVAKLHATIDNIILYCIIG